MMIYSQKNNSVTLTLSNFDLDYESLWPWYLCLGREFYIFYKTTRKSVNSSFILSDLKTSNIHEKDRKLASINECTKLCSGISFKSEFSCKCSSVVWVRKTLNLQSCRYCQPIKLTVEIQNFYSIFQLIYYIFIVVWGFMRQ